MLNQPITRAIYNIATLIQLPTYLQQPGGEFTFCRTEVTSGYVTDNPLFDV